MKLIPLVTWPTSVVQGVRLRAFGRQGRMWTDGFHSRQGTSEKPRALRAMPGKARDFLSGVRSPPLLGETSPAGIAWRGQARR